MQPIRVTVSPGADPSECQFDFTFRGLCHARSQVFMLACCWVCFAGFQVHTHRPCFSCSVTVEWPPDQVQARCLASGAGVEVQMALLRLSFLGAASFRDSSMLGGSMRACDHGGHPYHPVHITSYSHLNPAWAMGLLMNRVAFRHINGVRQRPALCHTATLQCRKPRRLSHGRAGACSM